MGLLFELTTSSIAAAARAYFNADLRGLRSAPAARSAHDGVTESDVFRSV